MPGARSAMQGNSDFINKIKAEDLMVSVLRGSCNLPYNPGLLGLWLRFANSLQKKLSLPAEGTLEISFFRKSFFINGCTFGKS